MSNIPTNVLFESSSPTGDIEAMEVLQSPPVLRADAVINVKLAQFLTASYLVTLLIQYAGVYFYRPFEFVTNRPMIVSAFSAFDLISFSICCAMFPIGGRIPTYTSFWYSIGSAACQGISMMEWIGATVIVLNIESMFMMESDSVTSLTKKVDVTVYMQFVTCFIMFNHCLSFLLVSVTAFMSHRALFYLMNGISRQTDDKGCFETVEEVCQQFFQTEIKLYRA